MTKRLIGFVMLALLLIAGQAMAADRFPSGAQAFNWNGFYAGVNVGGAWTSNKVTLNGPAGSTGGFDLSDLDTSGVIGGGQIGYNWQCGCWLLGFETDFQGADLDKTLQAVDLTTFTSATYEQSMNWFGTARGRAGWLVTPCLLVYGTGGFAYGDVERSLGIGPVGAQETASISSTKTETGWTAGGGIEWALSRCWSVKVEYLFMNLGSKTFDLADFGGPSATSVKLDQDTNLVRMGLNFKF